jgi:hypothetical protein
VTLGIALGLVGKTLGIFGATAAAVRAGVAPRPGGATSAAVRCVDVAGIGLPSLFIAALAFADAPIRLRDAKLGIIFGFARERGPGFRRAARRPDSLRQARLDGVGVDGLHLALDGRRRHRARRTARRRLLHVARDQDVDTVVRVSASRREAMFTGSPITVANSIRRSLPMTPATTSPVWIPTPNARFGNPLVSSSL